MRTTTFIQKCIKNNVNLAEWNLLFEGKSPDFLDYTDPCLVLPHTLTAKPILQLSENIAGIKFLTQGSVTRNMQEHEFAWDEIKSFTYHLDWLNPRIETNVFSIIQFNESFTISLYTLICKMSLMSNIMADNTLPRQGKGVPRGHVLSLPEDQWETFDVNGFPSVTFIQEMKKAAAELN